MLPFSAAKGEVYQSVLRYSFKLPARTVWNFQSAIYFRGDSVKALFKGKLLIKWIELFALQSVCSELITNWGCNGFPGWVKKAATAFNDYFSPYWCYLHSNTSFPGPCTIFLVTTRVQEKVVTFRSHQQWLLNTYITSEFPFPLQIWMTVYHWEELPPQWQRIYFSHSKIPSLIPGTSRGFWLRVTQNHYGQ